jgi:mannosyltransferase
LINRVTSTAAEPSRQVSLWLALFVVAVAAFLRLYRLGNSAMWFDELATVELALHDDGLPGVWKSVVEWGYPHPPLFTMILHLLFRAYPVSEFTARIIPAFGGILSVPLLYAYIARSVGRRAALLGACLLALSPYHIFYSQEARPYALSLALVLVTWLVVRRALREGGVKWWVIHTLCLVTLFYLHYFNVFVVAGEGLYVLLSGYRQRKRVYAFLLSGLVASLLFLPSLASAGASTVVLNRTPSHIKLLTTVMTMVSGETRFVSTGVRATGIVVSCLFLVLGLIGLRKRPGELAMSLLPLSASFLFVFVFLRLIGYVVPPYEDKQFVPVLPFLLALVAAGGDYLLGDGVGGDHSSVQMGFGLARRVLFVFCASLVLVSNALSLRVYYTRFVKNADSKIAAYINEMALPGDIVICNSYSVATTLSYYGNGVPEYVAKPCRNNRDGSEYLIKPCNTHHDGWEFSEQLLLFPDEEIRWTRTLDEALEHPRVWLTYAPVHGPEALTVEVLERTVPISEWVVPPFSLWLRAPR